MKTKLSWIISCLMYLVTLASAEAKVKLPSVFSDGMVLQRERPVKIWGTADPDEDIVVTFKKKEYTVKAGIDGKWIATLPAMKAGGPFELVVNDVVVKDILVGDVWLCSGQSNMELQVSRVADMFGKETTTYENPLIRYVKTPYGNDLHGPKDDIIQMNWTAITKESAPSIAALPYFFAIEMYNETKVPVGIINSSWGGSSIEAWMSEDALQAFPKNLRERDIFNSDEYKALANKAGDLLSHFWNVSLYKGDEGLHAPVKWYEPQLDDSDWDIVDVFSSQLGSKNGFPVGGSHWFRQTIRLMPGQAGKDAILRLGCLVNADSVYVNGIFVGTTSYQYPPRIYKVPGTILKAGNNVVTIRLITNGGSPAFVRDKPYCLAIGGDTVRFERQWKYKLGCDMPVASGGASFQNIPTGMYNSMISPLRNLSFKGVLWYQGETNTSRSYEYEALLTTMIRDWREKLADEKLPFFIMQLPNFMQTHQEPVESSWASLREAQRQATLKCPGTHLIVSIDLGEYNDIHPLNKKELARRTALQVKKQVYGHKDTVHSGPLYAGASVEKGKVTLSFEKGTDDLMPVATLEGFALAGADGHYRWADAAIEGEQVVVQCKDIPRPVKIRYAWDDNPQKANLKNKAGLPASPFQAVLPAPIEVQLPLVYDSINNETLL